MNTLMVANAADVQPRDSWYYEDNGFSSRNAMNSAHRPLLDYVQQVLATDGRSGAPRLRVLDLGCGNGALAGKIAGLHAEVIPAGVDVAGFKIDRARRLLPKYAGEFRAANLFDPAAFGSGNVDNYLSILMLGRLIEVPQEAARALLERLRRQTRHLLVYAYEDYVRQTMPFTSMASRVGLELLHPSHGAYVSLAQVSDAAGS